jgi:valyl-tRNA synthetase
MSKSKGNVLDPLDFVDGIDLPALVAKRVASLNDPREIARVTAATKKDFPDGIKDYGADALRFTLAAMAAQGRDIKLAPRRVEGYRNFATKLWNAARFAEMNGCARVAGFEPREARVALNRWIIGETAKAQGEVTAALESYRFNDAANAAYRFVWNIVCDWYVELSKPLLQGEGDTAEKLETRATTAFVLDEIVKLLHPFMPFITEELWAIKGEAGPPRDSVLALAPWSDLAGLGDPEAEAEVGGIVDLISEARSVRSEMNVPAGAWIALVLVGAEPAVVARVTRWDDTLKRMARLSAISSAAEAPPRAVQLLVRGTLVALPLEGIVDLAAEKIRLAKEVAKLSGEAEKIEAKLGNPDFIARAREEIVEEQRERLEDVTARLDKLRLALVRLGAG